MYMCGTGGWRVRSHMCICAQYLGTIKHSTQPPYMHSPPPSPHNIVPHILPPKLNTWQSDHLYRPPQVHSDYLAVAVSCPYPQGPNYKRDYHCPLPLNNPHQYYRHATSLNLTYIQFATQLHHQTSTLERRRAPEGTPISIRRCDHDSSNECYGIRLFRSLFGQVMTLRQLMRILLLALCYDSVTTALITVKPLRF